MNVKEYTESIIDVFEKRGGSVNPNVTLEIFRLIEGDKDLLREYNAMKNAFPGINPTMGRMIRAHYDLVNEKSIVVTRDQSGILKNYMRFRKRS